MLDVQSIPKDLLKKAVSRNLCEKSFYEFIKAAWQYVDATPYVDNWHIRCLAVHMQALYEFKYTILTVTIPPSHAKPCCVKGTVLEKTKGQICLGDVVVGDHLLTHKGRFKKVLAVHEQGVIPTIKVTTHSGRSLILAPDHPVLTARGWIESDKLEIDDVLAEVHPQEPCGAETMRAEEARLLGYLIGDGCIKYSSKSFVNQDINVINDFVYCAKKMGFDTSEPKKRNDTSPSYVVRLKIGRDKRVLSQIKIWLKTHDLDEKCSYDKLVPPKILSANSEIIKEFLGAYWSCDGYICDRGFNDQRPRGQCVIGCDTVSKQLAKGVQHLLNRLGISARLRTKRIQLKTKAQGDLYTSYTVLMSSFDAGTKFCSLIHIKNRKKGEKKDQFKIRTCFDKILNEDKFVSKEPAGDNKCRCLTIKDDSSFVYNDIAVHNSLVCSVLFPSWIWTKEPTVRFLTGSHNMELSIRDTLKSRGLIESPWYKENWGDKVILASDQNQKSNFLNTAKGYRVAISTARGSTGHRGDIILLDDAMSRDQAESAAERKAVNNNISQTIYNRQDIMTQTRFCVIGQRLHPDDYHNFFRTLPGCFTVNLPLEFEPENAFSSDYFKDPRTERNELLWDIEKFRGRNLEILKAAMGKRGYETQYQQRPTVQEGEILKRSYWNYYAQAELPGNLRIVQGWDFAIRTGENNDFTVCLTVGKHGDKFYLLDMLRKKMLFPEARREFMRITDKWSPRASYIEDAANGMALIDELNQTKYRPIIKPVKTGGKDKQARLEPFTPTIEAGNFLLPKDAPWLEIFLEECSNFPNGTHDDIVDCVSLVGNSERITAPIPRISWY